MEHRASDPKPNTVDARRVNKSCKTHGDLFHARTEPDSDQSARGLIGPGGGAGGRGGRGGGGLGLGG